MSTNKPGNGPVVLEIASSHILRKFCTLILVSVMSAEVRTADGPCIPSYSTTQSYPVQYSDCESERVLSIDTHLSNLHLISIT